MQLSQLFQLGLFWGVMFGLTFSLATLIMGRINAGMLLNDYPPDIRAKHEPMDETTRKQARQAMFPLLATLGLIIVLGLVQLRQFSGELLFVNTFIFTAILLQTWNLIDLVLLDWFLLMTIKPRFMTLPGTEGMAGYRDYKFHFRKFLSGIFFTLVLALAVTCMSIAVEWLI
jgi:hypothetical protein